MKRTRKIILSIACCAFLSCLFIGNVKAVEADIQSDMNVAQNSAKRTIKGVVKDELGEPLSGASVMIKGTTEGVTANIDGEYSISVPEGAVLLIQYIGYKSQEVRIKNQTVLDIVLSEDERLLDEVVVVGYGTQSRHTLTTSIGRYKGEKMEGAAVNSVGEDLKGKVAGLRVATTDAQPGSNPKFLIRGGSSINLSNDPIIMVDGVQRDMTGLNPNDIESIEVLKDAASAGIFGSRASNGVVLITTKKGSDNRAAKITFNAQLAYQEPATRFNIMSAADYLKTVRPAIAEGLYPSVLTGQESAGTGNGPNSVWTTRYLEEGEAIPHGWQSIQDPIDPTKTIVFQDNDQQDQWFGEGFWQSYYVGVNGGGPKMTYAASVGYVDDKGIGVKSGFSRFTFHGNTTFEIRKGLKVSSTFDYAQTSLEDWPSNKRNTVQRGLSIPNTHRDYLDDGTPARGTNNTTISAAFYKKYYDRENIQKRSTANINLSWEIIKDLTAVAQLTNHNRHTRGGTFIRANAISTEREVTQGFSETNRLNFQTYVNYKKTLKEQHKFDALLGYEYTYEKRNSLDAKTTGAVSDNVPTLQAGSESKAGYPRNTNTKEALLSYFGRVNYNLKDRYLASVTFRTDGSSRFAAGNRWGFFPAASVGWVVSEESFWNRDSFANSLKFRASYGQTGNNAIDFAHTYGSYSNLNNYGGFVATIPSVMPNETLKWETTTQLDIGFDLSLFKNRVRISADYYNKETKDLLFRIDLPDITGFSSVMANVGNARFHGFDLEVSSTNIETKDFSWITDLTYSYNMNKVLKLNDNGIERNRINGTPVADGSFFGGQAEGERLGRIYGYKVAHIIETQAQADAALYDTLSRGFRRSDRAQVPGRKDIGDYEWVNRPGSKQNGAGEDIIDAEDQFLLGYTTPHSTGGIVNTFKYKSFGLTINLDYAIGHSINNNLQMRYFMATMGNANYNLVYDVNKTWTQPGDKTKYARFTANDPDWGNRNYGRTSDVFVQKGDYLCIRDVTFSYDLPKKLISKLGMANATVSVTGNTLHYFTAVTGISPEAVTTGGLYDAGNSYDSEYNPYPPARKILFGVKVDF